MSKPWYEKPLWEKLYQSEDRVYLHAAVIIGHLGCSPFAFYDAAKKLPNYDEYKRAMEDMTIYSLRESPNPRCELRADAKKAARILIGPPPGDPEYAVWWKARLISVQQMKAEGKPVEWAAEPPVPLAPVEEPPAKEEPPTEKPKRTRRKKEAG